MPAAICWAAPGFDEAGGADLYRRGAGQDELQRVGGCHDAAMPIIGSLTALATCQTMRSATGLMAGPEKPR